MNNQIQNQGEHSQENQCLVIDTDKMLKAPPNPLVQFVSNEEFDKMLNSTTIIAQMHDPGVQDS